MQTPSKLTLNSPQELVEIVEGCVRENYTLRSEGYVCNSCSAQIEWVLADVLLHTQLFPDCSEGGRVHQIHIPYCPNCELAPSDRGCIHLPGIV